MRAHYHNNALNYTILGRKYLQHDGDSDEECDLFLPGEKNVKL